MKRLLLVLALAVVLLGLLVTPTFASSPSAPVFRLDTNTAYVFAYLDGSWFEVVGPDLTAVGHWATYDRRGNLRGTDPIPASYDIVMQESWKGYNYGLVQKLPTVFEVKLSIPEAGVDLSYAQAKAYWTGPFLWDAYWVANAGEIPAFNPNIGAQVYANRWLPPLTGVNGLATNLQGGKLPPGTYTVNYSERWVGPYTGLDQAYDDLGNPLWGPWHVEPPSEGSTSFTFTVARR
jgi:hypothetical protein